MDKKTCCVTGHRPRGFPWNYKDKDSSHYRNYIESMYYNVELYIRDFGINYFICGGAIGVDTDFAKAVIDIRNSHYPNVQLEIAVPCHGQERKWTEADKSIYNKILAQSDITTYVSKAYTPFCMQKRNEYMVDNADIVFAFWNKNKKSGGTYNTVAYAKKQNKQLCLFDLNDF